MVCAICKSADKEIVFKDSIEASEWYLNHIHYDYSKCNQCGFVQSFPIPPEADLLKFYEEQYPYEWFQKNLFYKKLQAKHRFYKISEHLKNAKRVLDFGCGHGFFVSELAKRNFNSYGFDIGADKIVQTKNTQITNKNSLSDYTESGFDVITMWHVLEHMRDHDAIIENLKSRLNPGGKLIIAVPNTGSLGFKAFKQKWGWTQQPYVHINMYNGQNLSELLASHGFSICSVTTKDAWDQSWYDLLITFFFYKNKSRNAVRKFNGGASGGLFFRANQIVRLLFAPVSYVISFLRASKNEGSELLVVVQRTRVGN